MTNLDSVLKGRNITLVTKICIVKAMVFPVVMYSLTVGPWRLGVEERILSSYGAGEDDWESLGYQENQTSESRKKSTLNIHWKH